MCSTAVDTPYRPRHSPIARRPRDMVPPADTPPKPTPVSGAAGFLLIVTACSSPITGGQTGDGSGVLPEPEPDQIIDATLAAPCEYEREPIPDGDAGSVGVSANEVLDFAVDTFETDITWPEDPNATVEYGPETSGGVQIAIRRGEGSAELLVPSADAGADFGCPPTLAVPVDVTVESEGGALRESFRTELRSISPELATFAVRIRADDLGGDLELERGPEDHELRSVVISGFVSPHGTAGTLTMQSGSGPDDELPLDAHWPSESCATTPYRQQELPIADDARVEGRDFERLRAATRALSPIPLRWSDGTESELTLTPLAGGRVCLADLGGAPRLRASVELELLSADGRLQGTLPGTLTDTALPGEPLWLSVAAELELEPAEFASRIELDGFRPEDFERVQANLWLDAGNGLSGGISIVGIDACDGATSDPVQSCDYSPVLDAGLGELPLTEDEPIVP